MRILKKLNLTSDFILQDVKEDAITVKQLETLHKLSNSYEALFSKRAKLYKEMDLKSSDLKERDFKYYILKHYTFLKRPVIVTENKIFIGNSNKVVEAAKQLIG